MVLCPLIKDQPWWCSVLYQRPAMVVLCPVSYGGTCPRPAKAIPIKDQPLWCLYKAIYVIEIKDGWIKYALFIHINLELIMIIFAYFTNHLASILYYLSSSVYVIFYFFSLCQRLWFIQVNKTPSYAILKASQTERFVGNYHTDKTQDTGPKLRTCWYLFNFLLIGHKIIPLFNTKPK